MCSARFLFFDFPGYFYAFLPLASELIACSTQALFLDFPSDFYAFPRSRLS
jgi:hypothetical protein